MPLCSCCGRLLKGLDELLSPLSGLLPELGNDNPLGGTALPLILEEKEPPFGPTLELNLPEKLAVPVAELALDGVDPDTLEFKLAPDGETLPPPDP